MEKPLLPLSTSMPAYSKLNQRRRITCHKCGLPIGYVPIDAAYLEKQLELLYEMNKRDRNVHKLNVSADEFPESHKKTLDKYFSLADSSTANHRAFISQLVNEVDNRTLMALFLPDAINIRVVTRCPTEQDQIPSSKCQSSNKACSLPYYAKFYSECDVIQKSDCVLCSGCDTCLGVRFEPQASINVIPSWPLCRTTGPSVTFVARFDEDDDYGRIQPTSDDEMDADMCAKTPINRSVEEEGWITLSLERVAVEPLFGLVGIDQYSIRYDGGEMLPTLYRAIEWSPLFSQNSATWMIPSRRAKSHRSFCRHKTFLNTHTWGRCYYDLERSEKAVPYTLCHGDMVAATIRRLGPIYPLPAVDDENSIHSPKQIKF